MPRCGRSAVIASAFLACIVASKKARDDALADVQTEPSCPSTLPRTVCGTRKSRSRTFLLQRSRTKKADVDLLTQLSKAYRDGIEGGVPQPRPKRLYIIAFPVVGIYVTLAACASFHARGDQETDWKNTSAATRLVSWDVMRFLLELMVIATHCSQHLFGISEVWTQAFRMPAFVFIAGVFGSSMSYKSVTTMLCYCFGTATMAIAVNSARSFLLHEGHVPILLSIEWSVNLFWFLPALAVWRLTVTPIFHATKIAKVPGLLPLVCVLVHLISYVLLHTSLSSKWLPRMTLYHGPAFAFGLLMTPTAWNQALSRSWVFIISTVILVFWYVSLALYPEPSNWNSIACFQGCRDDHVPDSAIDAPMSLRTFAVDTAMVLLRMTLALSVCSVMQVSVNFLEPRARPMIAYAAGWGSRTLYAYVLHNLILKGAGREVLKLAGPYLIATSGLPRLLLVYLFAFQFNIVLSSRCTERLFHWMVMPLWLRELAEKILGSMQDVFLRCRLAASPASELDLCGDGKTAQNLNAS